jgi:hypothetical protein
MDSWGIITDTVFYLGIIIFAIAGMTVIAAICCFQPVTDEIEPWLDLPPPRIPTISSCDSGLTIE